MKRIMLVAAVFACAFTAVAEDDAGHARMARGCDSFNFSGSGGAIVFPIFNLGF